MGLFHLLIETSGVAHVPCPRGKNAAKHKWQDVLLAAGVSGHTALESGTLPGCISDDERISVEAGEVVEVAVTLPSLDLSPKEMKRVIRKSVGDVMDACQRRLDYFGLALENN